MSKDIICFLLFLYQMIIKKEAVNYQKREKQSNLCFPHGGD